MSLKITCPSCHTPLTVPDELNGKRIRCKNCGEVFLAVEKKTRPADEEEPDMEDRLQSESSPVPLAKLRSIEEEEDDETRPRRRKKAAVQERSQALPVALIAGGAVVLLLLVVVVSVVATVMLARFRAPGSSVPTDVASVKPFQPGIPALPVNPVYPINPLQLIPQQPAVPAAPPTSPDGFSVAPGILRYRWEGAPLVYAVRVEIERDKYVDVREGNCRIEVNRFVQHRAPAAAQERKGTGTAFVVNANGFLVTCAHVVADATKVEVALGGRTYPATVLARDDTRDLAVLQIIAQNLPTLTLANSDAAAVGQEVRALGFPLASVLGDNVKATRGTVAGINIKDGQKVFQVDASINPGNSGGPLVTEMGTVLGVNSAKLAGEAISNVGFAVPSAEASRLLTSKGVAYQTGGETSKLDGPTLVKTVSPAVALVTVTAVSRVDPDTYRLTCHSLLGEHKKAKQGVIILPSIPSFPMFGIPVSTIEVDGSGQVLQASGGEQLPLLLGEVGLFLIEPLPSDGRSSWQTNKICTITEDNGGSFPGLPFGPRMPRPPTLFGPRRPFGPPAALFPDRPSSQAKILPATERCSYTRGVRTGDTVAIQKHSELKCSGGADGSPTLELVGDSQITFDVKVGLPRTVDFKAIFTQVTTNLTERVPLTVSYKLLEGTAREQVLKPPPPPKIEPKPVTEANLTQILANLKGEDKLKRSDALQQLAKAEPGVRRAEVARALEQVLADTDFFSRKSCLEALAVWGTRENVPALLKFVSDSNPFLRWAAMTALGNIGDEQGIAPVAARLEVFEDRMNASKVLQSFGNKAEKAVVPYLQHSDWACRLEACQILAVIGTKKSQAALEAASRDSNRLVEMEAKRAALAVAGRP